MAFSFEEASRRLAEADLAGRLGHAYLVIGPPRSGKQDLVRAVAGRVLSTAPEQASAHPDFHKAAPESKSRRIVIDQIRSLEHALRSKPTIGPRKVAFISDADRLQPQAANAFLKTLEEPPDGAHVFLSTALPGALLETILSRCIRVELQAPATHELTGAEEELVATLEALVLAPGSPAGSAFRLARKFQDILGRERESIRAGFEDDFKAEQAHYKQATDGTWLASREEQLKASAESAAVARRAELLQVLADWFADVLRAQHGANPLQPRPGILQAAREVEPTRILRQAEGLDETAALLARGVQEALAVEAGFLKIFWRQQ